MQQELDDAFREGHYAKKQIFCKSRLISWSHSRRFDTGVRLARRFAGKRLLDYGCGDGTYLTMLMASAHAPASAVGAELTTRHRCPRAGPPVARSPTAPPSYHSYGAAVDVIAAAEAPTDPDGFIAWFEELKATGPGQGDPLFPWLARHASRDELRWFLRQEVAGEAGFEDLVALTQVKMPKRPSKSGNSRLLVMTSDTPGSAATSRGARVA